MERFVKGDVVVISFPFSDLTHSKRRPAFVLAKPQGDDLILCQITSKKTRDNYAIPLLEKDFKKGLLKQDSNIRPNKIFTADNSTIEYKIGSLNQTKIEKIIEKVCSLIKS